MIEYVMLENADQFDVTLLRIHLDLCYMKMVDDLLDFSGL